MTAQTELAPRQQTLPAVEPQSDAGALMHIIERVAADPNMDVAKLEKLLELRERWEERQAMLVFNEAMARVQAKINPVIADGFNDQTNSPYPKLKTIVAELKPIYTAEGFTVSYNTTECESERLREAGWFRITGELTHVGGYTKHYHVDLPADTVGPQGKPNKTQIHGAKSSISYARVILLGLMFNFTTTLDVDDDGNAAGASFISDEEAATIRADMKAFGVMEKPFLNYLKCASIEEIPESKLSMATAFLERRRQQASAG